MTFKAVLLFASALLVQSISAFCGPSYGYGACGYGGYGCGYSGPLNALNYLNTNAVTVTNGGNLFVTCYSRPNSGVSVTSELGLNGILEVIGVMPFVSAVSFQNELPCFGAGCVDYSCGSCNNGIGVSGSLNALGSLDCGCACSC